jgi:mono/diheme cytochrome c family protein
MQHRPSAVATMICLAALAAATPGCGGSGEGLDANGRPIGEGGTGNGALAPTLASIQQNVFTPVCTACHSGGGAPQGLRLDAGVSATLLVGVPSNEVSSLLRVKPGDPDNSYLIRKLEGSGIAGARMPLGGPYLDAQTIAVIRQWISQGAQP